VLKLLIEVKKSSFHAYLFLPQPPDKTINPLPLSDAVWKQKIYILADLFSSVLSQFKKYHPPGHQKYNDLSIFKSLKWCISMGKILALSLKLNLMPNTLGCYGLEIKFYHKLNISKKGIFILMPHHRIFTT